MANKGFDWGFEGDPHMERDGGGRVGCNPGQDVALVEPLGQMEVLHTSATCAQGEIDFKTLLLFELLT